MTGLSVKKSEITIKMTSLPSTITKEEIRELPYGQFPGEIVLINDLEQLNASLPYLQQQPVLGFDTETKPSFKKGKNNSVALLQLANADKAFLIRVGQMGLPGSLKDLLADPSIVKAGVAIHDDIKSLQRLNFFEPGNFIEIQNLVQDYGIENFSLQKLAAIILRVRISKSQRLSNWENAEYTIPQQNYAATDAWLGYEIYNRLTETTQT